MVEQNPTIQPVAPSMQSWGTPYDSAFSMVSDGFDALVGAALKYENYRNVRDASGQGQADLQNSVTKTVQPNAKPLSATEYQQVAAGNTGAVASQPLQINTNSMILGGAALLGLLLFLRK